MPLFLLGPKAGGSKPLVWQRDQALLSAFPLGAELPQVTGGGQPLGMPLPLNCCDAAACYLPQEQVSPFSSPRFLSQLPEPENVVG